MAISERLKAFLERERIAYQTLPHRAVFTAHEAAVASHVADRQLAKALAAKDDRGGLLMAVLPASCRLDLTALKHLTGRHHLRLLHEDELQAVFPDCAVGALPPFGNLYGMPVYVDGCFARDQDIVFEAGSHHEAVRLPYAEFERAARPVIGEYCLHEREKTAAG
ncbi:MAG TPA: YbaK/EbsC family protein [Methylomirabilota bacterium]|nr:YbaK/EbsC family protein [Methylomirabilota bacterium]